MAFEFKGKLYFAGMGNPTATLVEVDPETNEARIAYYSINRAQGVSNGVHGLLVYDGEILMCLANDNYDGQGHTGGLIVASDDPTKGFDHWRVIGDQDDFDGLPAVMQVDGLNGGGIWDIIEYNGHLYVTIVTDKNIDGKINKQGFAMYRGDKDSKGNFSWKQIVGDRGTSGYDFGMGINYSMSCNMWVYNGYLYLGTYNDPMLDLAEIPATGNFELLYNDLDHSIYLYRMNENEEFELVGGKDDNPNFPDGPIGNLGAGLGNNSNQYVWRMGVHDDEFYIGTYDTSTLTYNFTQITDDQVANMEYEDIRGRADALQSVLDAVLGEYDSPVLDWFLRKTVFSDFTLKLYQKLAGFATDMSAEKNPVPEYRQMLSDYEDFKDGVYAVLNRILNMKSLDFLQEYQKATQASTYASLEAAPYGYVDGLKRALKEMVDDIFEVYDSVVYDELIHNFVYYFGCNFYAQQCERGFDLLVSKDGVNFDAITRDGFGDYSNHGLRCITSTSNGVYLGTANPYFGTQLWLMQTPKDIITKTIHVFFEGYATSSGDVTSTTPDTALKAPTPVVPEGKEFVGWKAMVGSQEIYTGAFNFTDLSKLVGDNWFEGKEAWLTFAPEFKDTTKVVKINYFDETEYKQVAEVEMTVPADAIAVNTGDMTLPEGYEFAGEIGDLPIRDGYVYVSVKKTAPATKDVTVVFYEDVATNEVSRTTIKVDADATYVNTGKLTAPEGYKMVLVGDLTIDENGYVFVKVEKIPTTKVVKINYFDETEYKQVAEVEMTVPADAIAVNTGAMTLPEGYEFAGEVGDLPIRDGYVYVSVKKAAVTENVIITFKVVNGTWTNGTTGNKTVEIEKGSTMGTEQIPNGMKPYDGYENGQWNNESALTGVQNQDATYTYTFSKKESDHNPPVVNKKYILNYETNGGSSILPEQKSKAWTKDYEDLPVPTRKGYTFDGWFYNKNLTEAVKGDVKVNGTVTIYAKWVRSVADPHNTGVADLLETEKHIQYLYGYPDGSFGCDRNMTRAEAAQMFYNLLLDKDVKKTITFTDVKGDEWYADAVYAMATLGVLKGYPDGTFQPDRAITRAEFTTMGMQFSHLDTGEENLFKDVSSSDWFHSFVVGASKYGWISGYPDGTFKPNDNVTRAEVTCLVNNMLGRSADESFVDRNSAKLNSFTDLTKSYWAYYPIMEAANGHDWRANNGAEIWTKLL